MDSPTAKRRVLTSLLLASPAQPIQRGWKVPWMIGAVGWAGFAGYVALRRAVIALLYKPVPLPEDQVLRDIPYRNGSADEKHRLDLFLPEGANWPVLIFIHGGGLNSGDKALQVGGADVYGNIGRFYASQGIGVAVINYRLQPKVIWRQQVEDAAHAAAWVYARIASYGGDPNRIFISGHSAGAHLATRVAVDPQPLRQLGLSPAIFSGVIAVSGAAFDLSDTKTYELGHKLRHYERRFRCGDRTDCWQKDASPIYCVAPGAPPFLVLYAGGESHSLHRQSQLLHQALQRCAIPSQLVVVPGQNHRRIVLTLSRPDKTSAPAILDFIARASRAALCPQTVAA